MMYVLWMFDADSFVMALVWFAMFDSGQVGFLAPQQQGTCRFGAPS